jgi:predicted component of type VI protein secretion system
MALDLHIAGPGFELTRRLESGEPALILGRDTDCTVCLPDPERNVSRRHLSVWNEGDQLHFHVLSVVNGVETMAGELPPGARGILPTGDVLALSAYRIAATPAALDNSADPTDPWTEFERQAAQLVPDASLDTLPAVVEDDPFGDWGFQSTFGPGSPSGSLEAQDLALARDLAPFLAGLGLDASGRPPYTHGELETIGRMTRIALQGLLQAVHTAAVSRKEVRAEDRTIAEPRELNPLRMDTTLETKLFYLLGGQSASAGFMPPDRAVAQVATELTSHQQAMGEAVQEAVLGVLKEFDPEALKTRLLGSGARLFESARAWDAFVKDYAARKGDQGEWVQRLLERYFAQAYVRALMRVKRNTAGRPPV